MLWPATLVSHGCSRDDPPAEPQVYSPYESPYTLPFPASAQPSAVATAPNVSYPDSNSSGVMALAHATTNFGLRFSGDDPNPHPNPNPDPNNESAPNPSFKPFWDPDNPKSSSEPTLRLNLPLTRLDPIDVSSQPHLRPCVCRLLLRWPSSGGRLQLVPSCGVPPNS